MGKHGDRGRQKKYRSGAVEDAAPSPPPLRPLKALRVRIP
jgi:hypothetical protein